MKNALIIVFILYGSITLSQDKPAKAQLIKIFKNSIDQKSKKSVSIGSGEWTICNQDSAFFKADIIKLYSNINYFYQISNCCDFVNWTFYKKSAFVQSTSQICKEPSSASVKTVYYQISIFSEDKRLYILLLKPKVSAEKFEVLKIEDIGLANNNSTKEITLKRIISNPIN